MRIRKRQTHHRPYKDLTDQTEAEALANFAMLRQEYQRALQDGRRQDVVNRFVLMDLTVYHCQETFGRAPELPVLPDDYRQEVTDYRQNQYLAAAEAWDNQPTRLSGGNLNAFLEDLQQQGRAAGLDARPSPEEKACYEKLFAQVFGPPNDPILDTEAIDLGLMLHHTPLWMIYRMISYGLDGVTSEVPASAMLFAETVPTEGTMASMVAVHLKMMTDLLRLTDGWDTTARRSATLAQLGLDPPEPPEPRQASPQGTA